MKEAAKRLNVSVATYREWERGRSIRDLARYVDLADVFKVSLRELLSGQSVVKSHLQNQINEIENRLGRLKTDLDQVLDQLPEQDALRTEAPEYR